MKLINWMRVSVELGRISEHPDSEKEPLGRKVEIFRYGSFETTFNRKGEDPPEDLLKYHAGRSYAWLLLHGNASYWLHLFIVEQLKKAGRSKGWG